MKISDQSVSWKVGAIQRLIGIAEEFFGIGIAEALLETSELVEILLDTNGIVSLETGSLAMIKPIKIENVTRLKTIQITA